MAQKILLRRGTKTQLDGITLSEGELGYTTDTRECYVGNGTNNLLVGRALVGLIANRPTVGVAGRIYEATDEGKTYLDNGITWKLVGIASLDDVPDGTTYAKVRSSGVIDGHVKEVLAETSTALVTGDEIKGHIDNDDLHRTINDGGTGATDLWSASKINTAKADKVPGATENHFIFFDIEGNIKDSGLRKDDDGTGTQDMWSANKIQNEINSKASGLSWQSSAVCLNMISDASQGGSPPVSPAEGDAYIANNWGGGFENGHIYEWNGTIWQDLGAIASGTRVAVISSGAAGSFAGQEENIADYDGSDWLFTSPQEGWALLITGDGGWFENNGYTYSAGTWIQFTGAGQINAGMGLSKSGNTLDVLLGAGIAQLPTDEVGIDIVPNSGLKLTSTLTDGQLAIDYDNSTIGIKGNQLSVKDIGITETQLSGSVAGNGLIGGAGTPLAIGVGNGIAVSANSIEAKIQAGQGLGLDANGLRAVPDATSVEINGSGQIGIRPGGITATQLNISVAGNGLSGGGGSPLDVGAGNGITVSANSISAKIQINQGLLLDSSGLAANPDGSTIVIDGTGKLSVNVVDGGAF